MTWTLTAFADEAGKEIDIQISTLRTCGIDHVDLRNVDDYNIVDLPLDHAKAVKDKLDTANISVCMYGSPIGKIDIAEDFEIDLKRLRHLGELKKIFGTEKVRMFSYFNKNGASTADYRKEAVRRVAALTELAADLGLVLYHENESHIFGEKLAEVCVLRDEVRAKYDGFKLIFDFDNYNAVKDDVWANWLELRDTTDAIHLKDSKWIGDKKCHVPAGQGDGRIPDILADAAKRGWTGPLTLEPHLVHSAAVMATGPSGDTNQAFNQMTPPEAFQVAAEAAIQLMQTVGKR